MHCDASLHNRKMTHKFIIIILCSFNIGLSQFGKIKNIDSNATYKIARGEIVKPEEALRLCYDENYSAFTIFEKEGNSNHLVILYKSYEELKGIIPDETIITIKKMGMVLNAKTPVSYLKKKWLGKEIPNFNFVSTNQNQIKKKDLLGKVLVFNFWFTTCSSCLKEMPELNKLVTKFKYNSDVLFIAPAINDDWTIKDFLKTNSFLYESVSGADFIKKLEISGFPTHLIVGKNGKILWIEQGSTKDITNQISKILAVELNE